MRLSLLALALIIAGLTTMASRMQADDWPAPVIREVFSPSRAYFVRVIPGKSFGDTVEFKSAGKGPFATAEFYRRENDRSYRLAATVSLLNPVAPADFFVTDNGSLITLDNWHNMGYGKVVAFYSQEGKPIKAYELLDLFTKSEIEGFGHRVSSIAWRKPTASYIRPGGETFNVMTNDTGGGFIFELSGAFQYCETRGGSLLCRVTNQGRAWRAFREPGPGSR